FIALIKYRFMDFESEIKRKENRLHLLANYDLTTQLPNRSLFEDRLDQALALAENYNTGVAVFLLDIDRFKRINETFGHRAGDLLLSGVARRLTSCQREGATLSRFEGDMFAIMMPNIHRVENAAVMAETVLSVISDPFIINGKEIFITSSIGISFFPWDQKNANPLLKCADIALQLAQQEGNNKYKFFTSDMHKKVDANLALESQLRHALKKNEFVVHYQPQFDLQTGKLVGAEALLRWHSLGGNIPPTEFIPIAEETGIILPLGDWVLKTVCEQIKAWQKMGFRSPVVAVNVSGKQLQRPNLVAHFTGIIEECGINPAFLCLELTESSLVTDIENTIQTFKKFREMGIQISIDDFGTGYSSLSYLMRFPISTLKIDKSFIKNITLDSNNSAISSAVISMAHSLRLKVVAEGVETEEQVDHLRDKGCDAAQGFYYSPAIPADQFLEILREAEASFPA
ncbi:MAG TPA: EAL domain-containing protein, partial [Nitrospiria bacterium]|nr:EAL domain-containing protein [Nitrospiria bacterium]